MSLDRCRDRTPFFQTHVCWKLLFEFGQFPVKLAKSHLCPVARSVVAWGMEDREPPSNDMADLNLLVEDLGQARYDRQIDFEVTISSLLNKVVVYMVLSLYGLFGRLLVLFVCRIILTVAAGLPARRHHIHAVDRVFQASCSRTFEYVSIWSNAWGFFHRLLVGYVTTPVYAAPILLCNIPLSGHTFRPSIWISMET